MKITLNMLLVGMVLASSCSIGSAQTLIYSQSFGGGAVDINGVAPTYINPNASLYGGTTSALFDVVTNNSTYGYYANQNGTLGSGSDSVLLPFTPQAGYTYTLSASLTFASVPPGGGWGALGFGANFPPSNGSTSDPRLNSTLVNGNPWSLLNYGAQGGGAILFDTRTHNAGSMANLMSAVDTPYTINFVLDTTGSQWTTALYVADTLVANSVYSSNPTINSIGYGQTATTAGAYQWNSLSLTAQAVPEPSVLALAGLGLASLCGFRRLRKYVCGRDDRWLIGPS